MVSKLVTGLFGITAAILRAAVAAHETFPSSCSAGATAALALALALATAASAVIAVIAVIAVLVITVVAATVTAAVTAVICSIWSHTHTKLTSGDVAKSSSKSSSGVLQQEYAIEIVRTHEMSPLKIVPTALVLCTFLAPLFGFTKHTHTQLEY